MKFETGSNPIISLSILLAGIGLLCEAIPQRRQQSICISERVNARDSAKYLKASLRLLTQLYEVDNIKSNDIDMPVCSPEETNSVEWTTELTSVIQRLNKYYQCFGRVQEALGSLHDLTQITNELKMARNYLDNLIVAIQKMKWPQRFPSRGAIQAPTNSKWREITNGHHLAKKLLHDLGYLNIGSYQCS